MSVFLTFTPTAPAAPAGDVARIEVELLTVTAVAAVAPNVTVAPGRNPVPEICTTVPPPVEPETGETLVTVGAGL